MEFSLFPTVGEVAQKNLCIVSSDTTVREAASLMNERAVSSVITEQNGQRYLFSVEDLLSFTALGRDGSQPLGTVLSHHVQYIDQGESVLTAMELLETRHEHYLGVTDSQEALVGIVTYTDILSSIDPSVLVEKKTIGELISRVAPVTFTGDWFLEDVLSHFNHLEDAIIVVEERKPVGIVTTKDLFRLIACGRSTSTQLASIMTSPVETTRMTSSIHEVLQHLKTFKIKRAVVVNDQDEVAGIVTQSQLVGFAYGSWINLIKYHASELRELVGILETRALNFEKQSLTDPLTGLANRRVLLQKIGEEQERIRRYNAPTFSIALIDIDYFKRINDTLGHLVGDQILRGLSESLGELIRKSDAAVRWGGEEFAVFMPQTSLEQAARFSERLLQHVAGKSFHGNARITISIGVGEFVLAEAPDALMKRIDEALYLAKSNGRNRVEQAPRIENPTPSTSGSEAG